ncbi:MAG: argininosuccinate lyase [Xanthomonadales bacterium]|nr:argininosuccinate lyase [Xanthomonadales bacterium]MBP7418971.1 argininosuccinate lyase [Xanthomonadales bacterium]
MSEPIWRKPDTVTDARLMRFLAGEDVLLDRELLPYDIRASAAHAEGLATLGILDDAGLAGVLRELQALAQAFAAGEFVLDDRYEDGHSAIEAWLSERLGDAGRRIHTGRSRNDQVLVASRLWLRDRLAELGSAVLAIADVALERAQREAALPMPGYTHLQRAVVSSAGMWWSGFAESFLDDARIARDALSLVDANPLGTAAGYGVNLALDRDASTRALGFARLQVSPVAAQLSRGKYEWQALAALAQALGDVRRLAWDLSLYTTQEYGFVRLPPEYTTGSSIMPNKRNPDVVELLRASVAPVHGAMIELQSLLSLPSGYQRDLQYTKGPFLRAMRGGLDALAIVPALLARMAWDPDRMRAAIEPAMYATDIAIEQAVAGVPFRDAYRQASVAATDAARTPEASLAQRVSPGAAADLRLDELRARRRAFD